MIAPVKSSVVAEPAHNSSVESLLVNELVDLPPISAVLTLPSLMTPKVALAMLFARLSRLRKAKR